MKRIPLSLVIFFIIGTVNPILCQDSLNMKKEAVLSGLGVEYNDVWGYQHGGKEYAVVGSNSAINIVDVSDCSNPVLVHQWVDGSSVIWRDFKDYEDYVYAVCDGSACNEGLQVINKNTGTHSQSLAQFRSAHNIFVEKKTGRLYVVGTNTYGIGIILYDIATDPANPIHLGNFSTGPNTSNGYIHDLYVENDTVYANHVYTGRFKTWDFTDLSSVNVIGDLYRGGYNHSNWKHPEHPYVYVATETHGKPLEVYDVSDPTGIEDIYSFKDPLIPSETNNYIAHNPYVYLNRLYISNYHDGIKVYDVSEPTLPVLLGYYDTYPENTNYSGYDGAWGTYPFLESGCILVSDITHGLFTLRMTVAPEAKTRFAGTDFVIDNIDKGLIIPSVDGGKWKLTVDNIGNIDIASITSIPTQKLEVKNAGMAMHELDNSIYFKVNTTTYYKLVSNSGVLTTALATPPAVATYLLNEDVYFSQYMSGITLQDAVNGKCYEFTISNGGVISTSSCD